VPGPAVSAADTPDPFVLAEGGAYHAYATQSGPVKVQVLRSEDLSHWEHRGDALAALPVWSAPGRTWSPSVVARQGRYRCYYATRHRATGRQAISVATAATAEGPFVDESEEPLILQADRGGSIDPSPFLDVDGSLYLLWKSDDNALGRRSSLWGQRLIDEGTALVGERSELLRLGAAWERPLVEAPCLLERHGTYVLFYSGGWWESAGYGIGYATGSSPMGPFTRTTRRRPWMASGPEGAGPGGQEVFADASGALRLAYHAWDPAAVTYRAGGARRLRIARLDVVDGDPVVV